MKTGTTLSESERYYHLFKSADEYFHLHLETKNPPFYISHENPYVENIKIKEVVNNVFKLSERSARSTIVTVSPSNSKGVEMEIEPIGNHSRGTTFLNGNRFIDEQLNHIFDEICFQMDDIYYGRFDLKCESIEGIKQGKGFKVMEFNGVGSEPAHIYDPAYSKIQAYKDLYQHCKILYEISIQQRQKGVIAMSLKELVSSYQIYNRYLKSATSI